MKEQLRKVMVSCVMCGASLPINQGSGTCSMCYGDIDHGKDGYYREYLERQEQREAYEAWEREQEQEELNRLEEINE
jgi:hypothetical protein